MGTLSQLVGVAQYRICPLRRKNFESKRCNMIEDWSEKFANEIDAIRVRIGRFSEADEKIWNSLFQADFLAFPKGRYPITPNRPKPFSSRPTTASGGQSFSFRHNVTTKAYSRPVPNDRTYIRVPVQQKEAARNAGAKWDGRVGVEGLNGAYWMPIGTTCPSGCSVIARGKIYARWTGENSGSAANRQRYIERLSAIEHDHTGWPVKYGNIGATTRQRASFWAAAEKRERRDGRVQSRIIAELPFEEEIGTLGREKILFGLGMEFEQLGLIWHGVVHKPDEHSDPRNFHLHLLYHDRPARWSREGRAWIFSPRKHPAPRRRDFIKKLRHRYAELVNEEFKRAGLARRFDPRTFEEMGIAKTPTRHLGVRAAALERRGRGTSAGRHNYGVEWHWRILSQLRKRAEEVALLHQLPRSLSEYAEKNLGNRNVEIASKAQALKTLLDDYENTSNRFGDAKVARDLVANRQDDFSRRLHAIAESTDDKQTRIVANRRLRRITWWADRESRTCNTSVKKLQARLMEIRLELHRARRDLKRAERNHANDNTGLGESISIRTYRSEFGCAF